MTRISERIENFLRAFSIYSDAVAEYKKTAQMYSIIWR